MKDDYKNLVRKAVSASTSLGLLSENNAPSFSSDDIQASLIYPILWEFEERLYSLGLDSSRSLNGNCIQVHDQLQDHLQRRGVESHMTIGSMHGQGWDYFPTSVDALLAEMADPHPEREIRAHTWLTLNDGSVLDWTGQAWYDTQVNENHPAGSCLVYFQQGVQNETHYYHPVLVGREYLIRTGSIRRVPTR
ncbi:hypothetical protein [Stenotrophomonas sp. PFBMAA-4]|uniref:hypothetical protein n=1 Tax=Stenotrophomonas sp. PFBMAA-4 TaxID=3043301 RepID=UPI0024B55CDD|nr:hypothetical protein [Stenotrophomonas sp. PFBMAA-4]MDI9271840.1 hypothetical protein [Stenotrophomonas sp. PFBMAA-4]